MEVCNFLQFMDPKSPLGWIANHLNEMTGGNLIHPCPYLPGHYSYGNISTDIKDYPFMNKGTYKSDIFARNDEDPNGVNATMVYTLMIRGGDEFFG
jgi:hypothetical protein